jgi:hypothetical protein
MSLILKTTLILLAFSSILSGPSFQQSSFQAGFTEPPSAIFGSNRYFNRNWLDTATGLMYDGEDSPACNKFDIVAYTHVTSQDRVFCLSFGDEDVAISQVSRNFQKLLFFETFNDSYPDTFIDS